MTLVLEVHPGEDVEVLASRLVQADAAVLVAHGLGAGDAARIRGELRRLGVDWTRVVVVDAERDPWRPAWSCGNASSTRRPGGLP